MIPERVEPARHLYIATPSYDGMVSVEMAFGLASGALALERAGISIAFDFLVRGSFIDHQRNILATRFMESDATDLLFLDADIGFHAADLVRLAQMTRPFVGGIYPKREDAENWAVSFDVPQLWSDADGLVEASGVGAGFLRINRAVFAAMDVPTYQRSPEPPVRRYFQMGPAGGTYVGEDIDFCTRARALGGKLFVVPDMTLWHTGHKTWRGNWGEWMLARLKKEAA